MEEAETGCVVVTPRSTFEVVVDDDVVVMDVLFWRPNSLTVLVWKLSAADDGDGVKFGREDVAA